MKKLPVIALMCLSAAAGAQDCWANQDLGTLPGGSTSEARGVSADGSVVVGRASTAAGAGVLHAFRWTASGGMEDLGTLGGAVSVAEGVSADGSVVVGQSLNAVGLGLDRAFRWTAGGGMQDLGTLGGATAWAYGASADGSVVVGRSLSAAGASHAFRWTAGGGMQDLGTLGGASSAAHGVSADGSVVVGAAHSASGALHAFRWTAGGGMQDLGTLGGTDSYAFGVSADGSAVIGRASTPSGASHAFRWTAGGAMQDLGTLGGTQSHGHGVSAGGSVVVGRATIASGAFNAFRWTTGEGMQSLGTLGGAGSWAQGVSADGSVVVGHASNASFNNRAVRWNGVDSDGDGLLDCWETNGIDIDADGVVDLDLPAMGALVDRKDIFIEVDAMVGRVPTMAQLQGVIDAFDQAPIPAPPGGGADGIALHVLIDESNIPRAPFPGAFTEFDALKATRYGTAAERADPNWPNIKAARDLSFRYCLFGDTYSGSSSSGLAELPGNDFMVTLGGWSTPGGTADQRAGTFMHELGHTLGLGHGGADSMHYKPNYYSVMNYRWQTPQTGYASQWRLDYSREELAALNESALDESVSLGATRPEYASVQVPFTTTANTWEWARLDGGFAVDWNGDGMTPAMQAPVAADINRMSAADSPGTLTTLAGFDDWANLRYALAGHANFGDGREATTIDDEFDLAEFEANEQIPPPPLCPGDIADDFGTLGADGMVSFGDFLALLGLIGPCPGGTPGCVGDIADDFGTLGGDGMVSFGDFLALLGLIGPCP